MSCGDDTTNKKNYLDFIYLDFIDLSGKVGDKNYMIHG